MYLFWDILYDFEHFLSTKELVRPKTSNGYSYEKYKYEANSITVTAPIKAADTTKKLCFEPSDCHITNHFYLI